VKVGSAVSEILRASSKKKKRSLLATLEGARFIIKDSTMFGIMSRKVRALQCCHLLSRDAMDKRGLCRHAVSVCLFVSLSRSYILSKWINISAIFLQSGSQAILVFPHETSWHHSDGKGIRTQAFEWYQFEWSCVISNPDFKVTILIQRQITQKQYKILLYLYWLQWRTYRKSYMICRTVPFSMTLNNH